MEDIKKRLQDAVDTCLKNYEAWDDNKKETELRENLQESIHELRKVGSRLEIEIAVSERNNANSKPLPIPTHRSTSKAKGAVESILPDEGNTVGNNSGGKKDHGGGGSRRPRKRPAPKKSSN